MSKKSVSRRNFLGSMAIVAGATALPASTLIPSHKRIVTLDDNGPEWPLPYVELDVREAMRVAHDTFFKGGCAYGAFQAFLTIMRERVGGAYNYIPGQLIRFGKGGVMETGTLCGALTGTLAAINLVSNNWGDISKELIHWYSQTLLPTDETNEMAINNEFETLKWEGAIEQSLSDSPLCHVSVTKWCEKTGATVTSAQRVERCGRVTAATLGKAVELLNKDYWGEYGTTYVSTEDTETCLACHGKKGTKANVLSEMQCKSCHGNPHAK